MVSGGEGPGKLRKAMLSGGIGTMDKPRGGHVRKLTWRLGATALHKTVIEADRTTFASRWWETSG